MYKMQLRDVVVMLVVYQFATAAQIRGVTDGPPRCNNIEGFSFGSTCGTGMTRHPLYSSPHRALIRQIAKGFGAYRSAIRNQLAPTVTMRQFVWSDVMAEKIQARLEQCDPRCIGSMDFYVEDTEWKAVNWTRNLPTRRSYKDLKTEEKAYFRQIVTAYQPVPTDRTNGVHINNLLVSAVCNTSKFGCGAVQTNSSIRYACMFYPQAQVNQPILTQGIDLEEWQTHSGNLSCDKFTTDLESPGNGKCTVQLLQRYTSVDIKNNGDMEAVLGRGRSSEFSVEIPFGLTTTMRDLCLNITYFYQPSRFYSEPEYAHYPHGRARIHIKVSTSGLEKTKISFLAYNKLATTVEHLFTFKNVQNMFPRVSFTIVGEEGTVGPPAFSTVTIQGLRVYGCFSENA